MSNNGKYKKIIFMSLVALFLVLAVLFVISISNTNNQDYPINNLRIESNTAYIEIQDMWTTNDYEYADVAKKALDSGIFITIIDLEETVIYSNSQYFDSGNIPILNEALYMDESYANNNLNTIKLGQPLYKDQMVNGFVIFESDYVKLPKFSNNTIFLGLSILVIFTLLSLQYAVGLFKRNNNELVTIEKALINISKGMLVPIKINKNSQYQQIYHTFNMLIDELKYMMEQREYNQEQRKSFLTTISHELKTPVATISAYVEGLKNGIADDETKREQYINIIYDKMQMLNKLIEDFFSYTQEDENRFKYNFSECYADELIDDIFVSIASQNDDRTTCKNVLTKCIINVDKFRIEQVILNLYNNAMKHTPTDQSITLLAYREDNDIVIEVSDNGEGIAVMDLPYIFDYYYQGITAKSKDYQGVGLGLAISKNIIDTHKGRIKVKSTEGTGTSMYVYIPVV